jgi:hypothetical protein
VKPTHRSAKWWAEFEAQDAGIKTRAGRRRPVVDGRTYDRLVGHVRELVRFHVVPRPVAARILRSLERARGRWQWLVQEGLWKEGGSETADPVGGKGGIGGVTEGGDP